MRGMVSKFSYANVMSTLALFVALGGGAYAASTFVGSSGVVRLCASKNGTVKVLARAKRCTKGSQLINVDQRGQPGAPGLAGARGPAGMPGTNYSVGSGLTLSGNTVGVDPTQLQARIVASGCAADQTLQSVAQNGTPTCTGLHAYSATAGVDLPYADGAIPPGKWVLLGQMTAGVANTDMTVYCQIDVNGAAVSTASQFVPHPNNGSVSLTATSTTTTSPATPIAVSCNTAGTGFPTWSDGTITAIPVAALN